MNQRLHDPSYVSHPTTIMRAGQTQDSGSAALPSKRDADYVFYEFTRSICPECRRVVDEHILLRDNKVYMRKRCPEHGIFEGLVYGHPHTPLTPVSMNLAPSRWHSPPRFGTAAHTIVACVPITSNMSALGSSR